MSNRSRVSGRERPTSAIAARTAACIASAIAARTATCIAIAAAMVGAALSAAPGPAPAAARCFGAAARDPAHPCFNPTRSITPTLDDAERVIESPCEFRVAHGLSYCLFGTPARQAKARIALIGDSHAWHWRAAVDHVARAEGWLGYSVTGPGCSFSDAVRYLPAGARAPCIDYYRKTRAWLQRHRDVSTVFVSQRNATEQVPPPGQTTFALRVAAFERAWTTALPRTVKHVIVIRDVPQVTHDTFPCLARVLAAKAHAPGPACAMVRSTSLTEDVAGAAVAALHSKRYRFVDMSQYFCDGASCFPVVGGVLVYRDSEGHITPLYADTLGPYLLRKVQILKRSWEDTTRGAPKSASRMPDWTESLS
jgi:hypothetical protein